MSKTRYTDELAQRALDLIANGATIRKAARDIGVPTMTLWTWINDQRGLFVHSERAREAGFDAIADECVEIADTKEWDAQDRRVRIDTRLRLLGKWSKRYADKVSHEVTMRRAEEMTDDELAAVAGSASTAEATSATRLPD